MQLEKTMQLTEKNRKSRTRRKIFRCLAGVLLKIIRSNFNFQNFIGESATSVVSCFELPTSVNAILNEEFAAVWKKWLHLSDQIDDGSDIFA